MAAAEPLESPRITALRQALEVGERDALVQFWQDVRRDGAPLVEPIEGDDRHALVTFIWKGDSATEHVLLKGSFTRGDIRDNPLARLLDTDLWFRSYCLRKDLRTTYLFSPNNPVQSWGEVQGWAEMTKHTVEFWQLDPLNPRTWCLPHDAERPEPLFERPQGYLEMPDAPPQPYLEVRPAVPHGQVELVRFHSDLLDNDRRVWVYTPPGYRPDAAPYPLLLLFDGWAYVHVAPQTCDNLLAEGRIAPLVAVLLDFANDDRTRELTCYPPFADHISKELIPWVRERYNVTGDPEQAVVGGMSLGGLAAAYTAWRHPELFGNVLSQSGSYWWAPAGEPDEWLARQVATSDKRALCFYLDVGDLEDKPDKPWDGSPTQLTVNRHMRDVLQAKGYKVHYAEYSGGHEFLIVPGTLVDGLMALIGSA